MDTKRFAQECFELDQICQWIDYYSKATGIASFIIDDAGSIVYHALKGSCSQFCEAVQAGFTPLCDCENVHLYGSYQAERFGGKYIYFCPMGLTHWVAPIECQDQFKGAFVGGPVLMIEPEAFLIDEIIEQRIQDYQARRQYKAYMDLIPVVKPDVVTSLSELLYLLPATPRPEAMHHYLSHGNQS